MNVLLMALSTFSGKEDQPSDLGKRYGYYYKDGQQEYTGEYCYQMEPVVQVLSKKLQRTGDTLDAIVMLCSKEVMKEKAVILDNEEKRISPLAYFKEQAMPWMNQESQTPFYPLSISESDPSEGIAEAVERLRQFNKSGMCLYLDNHGAFRSTQLAVDAILSLLKIESIQVKEVFNVSFGGSNCVIDTRDTEFKLFDFVSGINEFINYGRIDSLKHYFDTVETDRETKELLSIISGIAEAIQLCNVPDFEENLKQLSEFFAASRKPENKYLDLFYYNIKNDYHTLLKEKHNTLDEVEWCLKKGFYQQCLTLIEGKMPKELAEKGVIKWGKELDDYAGSHCGYFEKSLFIFNASTGGSFLYFKEYKNKESKDIEDKLCSLIKSNSTRDAFLKEIYSWKLAWKVGKLSFYDKKWDKWDKEKGAISVRYQDQKEFYAFLVLHKALKIMRNMSNHAAEKATRIPVTNIRAAIETYIFLGRGILK